MELVKFKEQINETIALFEPEMAQILGQNLFTYFLLNRVEVTEDEVIISTKQRGVLKKINYNKGQFFAKMIDMSKQGFDLLAGDFYLTPYYDSVFKQYSPNVVIHYKKRLQILLDQGYTVVVHYLRKGDSFVEIKPYVHKFDVKPKVNSTKSIQGNKAVNDVLFYGVEIIKIETGKAVCSYVESTENIKARANFSNDMFHNSPNAQDTMHVKFVLNRAYEYLHNYGEIGLPNIGKLEDYQELTAIEITGEAVEGTPKIEPKKNPRKLTKNSKTWENITKRLEMQTATIEQIADNYDVADADLLELQKIVSKNAKGVKLDDDGGEDEELSVFDKKDDEAKEEEGSNEI